MHYIKRFLNHLFSEKTLARICHILGIIFSVTSFVVFLKMLLDLFGFSYMSMSMAESSVRFVIGEMLPIDIGAIVWGIVAILLANIGILLLEKGSIIGKIARAGAIVIIILSFTPISTFTQSLPRLIIGHEDKLKVINSQEDYKEFSKYVNVTEQITLTNGTTNSDVKEFLLDNLTELGKETVQSISINDIRDYEEITVILKNDAKKIVYPVIFEELDYPSAYFQMKYMGRTVVGCKEELEYEDSLMLGDVKIAYPTMMQHDIMRVDTIYNLVAGADGQIYENKILIDSTSMYSTFSPELYENIPTQISELPVFCESMVYEAVNYLPGEGTQTYETSETLEVNDILMQRTSGVLTGSEYGANGAITSYCYVAYYFFVEEEGVSCPAVMIAIGDEQITTELDDYIDDMIQHVERCAMQ